MARKGVTADLDALLRTVAALLVEGGRLAVADLEEDPTVPSTPAKPGSKGDHGFDPDRLAEQLEREG